MNLCFFSRARLSVTATAGRSTNTKSKRSELRRQKVDFTILQCALCAGVPPLWLCPVWAEKNKNPYSLHWSPFSFLLVFNNPPFSQSPPFSLLHEADSQKFILTFDGDRTVDKLPCQTNVTVMNIRLINVWQDLFLARCIQNAQYSELGGVVLGSGWNNTKLKEGKNCLVCAVQNRKRIEKNVFKQKQENLKLKYDVN